jgi:hypothetical protein
MESIKPERHGKKWEKSEVFTLLRSIRNGVDIQKIADSHKRTFGSIKCQLKTIAAEMHSKNIPIEDIEKATTLTPSEINDAVEWIKNNKIEMSLKNHTPDKKQAIIDLLKDVQEIQRKLMVLLEED